MDVIACQTTALQGLNLLLSSDQTSCSRYFQPCLTYLNCYTLIQCCTPTTTSGYGDLLLFVLTLIVSYTICIQVAVADHSGVITCFGMKKGAVQVQYFNISL